MPYNILLFGLKCGTIDFTLGCGKKLFGFTKNVSEIFNLKFVSIDNLP